MLTGLRKSFKGRDVVEVMSAMIYLCGIVPSQGQVTLSKRLPEAAPQKLRQTGEIQTDILLNS